MSRQRSRIESFRTVSLCLLVERIASLGQPKDSISNIYSNMQTICFCFLDVVMGCHEVCAGIDPCNDRGLTTVFLVLAEWHLDSSFALLCWCSKCIILYDQVFRHVAYNSC